MSYSAMSTKSRNPYETLEKMLNKTTLTTQRVAHSNIIGKTFKLVRLGGEFASSSPVHVDAQVSRQFWKLSAFEMITLLMLK